MKDERKEWIAQSRQLRSVILFVAIVLVIWLVFRLRWVLTPFVLAFLVAYILTPVVDWLERRGISRLGGVIILSLLLLLSGALVMSLVVPPTVSQFNQVVEEIPQYQDWILSQIRTQGSSLITHQIREHIREALESALPAVQSALPSLARRAGEFLMSAMSGAFGFVGLLVNIGVFIFVLFYLLMDFHAIRDRLVDLIPPSWREEVLGGVKEIDQLMRGYLRGQVVVTLFLGTWFSVGLSLIDLRLGVLIGIVSGILCIIPYAGSFVGHLMALLMAAYQGTQDGDLGWVVLKVLIVYGTGQLIEGNVVTPNVIGRSVGLSPVVVIFALMAGAELFGFFGMLAAIPLACVAKVAGERVMKIYRRSRLYQEGVLSLEQEKRKKS